MAKTILALFSLNSAYTKKIKKSGHFANAAIGQGKLKKCQPAIEAADST